MSIYLRDIALDEATQAWQTALSNVGALQPLDAETVPLNVAHGRVTARAVYALISSPHYHASAMDGYAVHSAETVGATETQPKHLRLGAQAIYVDTGDAIPQGYDAVIKIEEAQVIENTIEILAAATPWQYIRPMGEDMTATELVLSANHRIRPQDLGALAGSGHTQVSVYRQPRVAIIPTGTELVPPSADVRAGEIIEYNTLVLGAMAQECGAMVTRYPIHKDDYAAIKATAHVALQTHDIVIINAGSSAGSEDFTERIFNELGEICVHGVAIRPGHPVMLGAARDAQGRGKALAGIPGYPVSAAVTFDLFVRPLLYLWQGQLPPQRPTIAATLTRKTVSPMGDDEFLRVSVGQVGDQIVATPMGSGAGVITSMVKSDGIVRIPRFSEGVHQGATVTVELHTDPQKVNHTILAIGSHDMTLDLLADELRQRSPLLHLSSAHVGSTSGLLALQRGQAHLAGSHLLNEASGEYNLAAIEQMLTPFGVCVVVLGFVNRVQGLIVPRGNPKRIADLSDLTRPDVSFVNRQRGAGTRVLLDYQLKTRGINAREIRGYERQEFTHLALAAQVASGAADCGLGILAAARALQLDFVPLFNERYDLIIPTQHYESALLQPLLQIIRSAPFAQRVQLLGGYETTQMGVVLAER